MERVTRVLDVGVWREQALYMVMELLEGTDLRRLIKTNGRLPIHVAVDCMVQVCTGMAEAHALGIVHRDLEPSNLFLTRRSDATYLVKILDFGVSKWQVDLAEGDLTRTGTVLGSPRYMSPEQLFTTTPVDARSDIWSLGAICYEMLGGRVPFDEPSLTRLSVLLSTGRPPAPLRELRPDVPEALDAVVRRCLRHAPEQRPQTVGELAGAMLAAIGSPQAESVRNRIAATLHARGRAT